MTSVDQRVANRANAAKSTGPRTPEGKAVVRKGDPYAPHACPTCPAPVHPRSLSAGSGSVYVNGIPAGRVGDSISCGGAADAGASDVSFGD